jgi:nitrogen fixation NifU-like protein
MDYYRRPRNAGTLEDADFKAKDSNPLCGDEVEMFVKLQDGKVDKVRFKGKGCAISQATSSILTELISGKNIDELKALTKEKVLSAIGSPELGPVRIKCALLPLKVLKLGLYSHLGSQLPAED